MATVSEDRVRGRRARLLRAAGLAAFISAGLGSLACDRVPSHARADTVLAQSKAPAEAPVAAAKPELTPPPSTGTPTTPERIIDVIADKGAYPVPMAGAAKKFAPIATLARETPTPETVLMAGSGPSVKRLEIGYTSDGHGKWIYSETVVLLTPSPPDDVAALHKKLEAALRKKLGKPKFTRKDDPLPQMGWKLDKRGVELILGEETSPLPGGSTPERHIRIDVAAPNGDAD